MRFFLLSTLILTNSLCISQSPKQNINSKNVFDNFKKEQVEFKIKTENATPIAFSNIQIIDKRYDTLSMGYFRYDNPSKEYYKLTTKNYLSIDLQVFLNNIYSKRITPNDSSLIIVLRKFWFNRDYDFTSNVLSQELTSYYFSLGVDCYYFFNNKYIPLLRRDTILEIPQKRKDHEKGILIGENLNKVLNNLFELIATKQLSKSRKLSYQELNEYYGKHFRTSILTDQQLRKGVYMSFDEFKNNSPSYINFDIRKTKLADDIYILDGNDAIASRTAWGYCDGENLFIKLGTNLFPLYRQGNNYSLLGNDKLTHKIGTYTPNYNDRASPGANLGADALGKLLFNRDKFKLELIPLKLDMETGETY